MFSIKNEMFSLLFGWIGCRCFGIRSHFYLFITTQSRMHLGIRNIYIFSTYRHPMSIHITRTPGVWICCPNSFRIQNIYVQIGSWIMTQISDANKIRWFNAFGKWLPLKRMSIRTLKRFICFHRSSMHFVFLEFPLFNNKSLNTPSTTTVSASIPIQSIWYSGANQVLPLHH